MQIFPKGFLEHSKEFYLKQITNKGQIIYLVFLLAVFFALLALPFIKIDTFTQARGLIKTGTEQHTVYSAVTAPIQNLYISEKQ